LKFFYDGIIVCTLQWM